MQEGLLHLARLSQMALCWNQSHGGIETHAHRKKDTILENDEREGKWFLLYYSPPLSKLLLMRSNSGAISKLFLDSWKCDHYDTLRNTYHRTTVSKGKYPFPTTDKKIIGIRKKRERDWKCILLGSTTYGFERSIID
mmetsp:Transcript_30541/g.73263  ORF Transcript_30541/g.73263 Transcript_30541/m.73263 type:complete len:137 (+) Transcript_30541:917-1327(+)